MTKLGPFMEYQGQQWVYIASYIMPNGDAHMIHGEVNAPNADLALDLAHAQLPPDAASVSMFCEAPRYAL